MFHFGFDIHCLFDQPLHLIELQLELEHFQLEYLCLDHVLSPNCMLLLYIYKKRPIVYIYVAAAAVLSNLKRIDVAYQPTTVVEGSWRQQHGYLCQLSPNWSSDKSSFQPAPYLSSIFTVIKSRLMNFNES